MRLYLVRHGEATSKEEDPDRPLTEAGAREVREVAGFLFSAGGRKVAEIRHSTKLRARQTAKILAEQGGDATPFREVDGLEPMADVAGLAEELTAAEADIMLVGHLPHLDRLASRLVAGSAEKGAFDFDAASVLCLSRHNGESRPSWTVEWMVTPRLLAD